MSLSLLYYRFTEKILKHKKLTISLWFSVLVLGLVVALLVMKPLSDSFNVTGMESQQAMTELQNNFPQVAGTSAQIVVVANEGDDINDASYSQPIKQLIADFEDTDYVEVAGNPYEEMYDYLISSDQEAAIIYLTMNFRMYTDGSRQDEASEDIIAKTDSIKNELPAGSQIEYGGQLFQIDFPELTIFEGIGVIVAFIVLLLMFGTFTASIIPIISSLLSLGLAVAVIFGFTSVESINSVTPMLTVMLCLAVGIDYGLFILSKYVYHLKNGVKVDKAIMYAVSTAGAAVTFAGITVIIALLGLSLAFLEFLTVMGIFTAIGILFTIISSITFLPAVLGIVKTRVLSHKYRLEYQHKESRGELKDFDKVDESEDQSQKKTFSNKFYTGWFKLITKVPLLTVILIVVGLGALTLPALNLHLAIPGALSLPDDNPAHITQELEDEHFTDFNLDPIIVTGNLVYTDEPVEVIEAIGDKLAEVEGVGKIAIATPNLDATQGIIQILPTTPSDDPKTEELVANLRAEHDEILDEYGFDLKVTGFSAIQIDISTKLFNSLLPFLVVVFILSFLLLLMIFRSLYLPIAASIGFLLSIGSALGTVTLFYGDKWLANLIQVSHLGSVLSFAPILMMSILFGLAMDYQVFSGSMYVEEYKKSGDSHKALFTSFLNSSKVIVAAFVVMFILFLMFIPNGNVYLKCIALGLATGVLVDAVLVRMMLMPAIDLLVGKNAFKLPKFIEHHLPHIDIEGKAVLEYELLVQGLPPSEEYNQREIEAKEKAQHKFQLRSRRAKYIVKTLLILIVPTALALGLFATLFHPEANLENQKTAIVNLDEGTTLEGQYVPLGRQFAQQLSRDGENYDWIITNEEDALDGVKNGEYLAAVVIPENFSEAITQYSDPEKLKQAQINISVSDISRIEDKLMIESIMNAAVDAFSNDLSGEYLSNLFVGFNTLGEALVELADGTDSLLDGTVSLADGIQQLTDASKSIQTGLQSVSEASDTFKSASGSLISGSRSLSNGTSSLANASKQLNSSFSQLNQGLSQLPSSSTISQLNQGIKNSFGAIAELNQSCAYMGASEEFCSALGVASMGLDTLEYSITPLLSQLPTIKSSISQLNSGESQFNSGLQAYLSGAGQYFNGSNSFLNGLNTFIDGAGQLGQGWNQFSTGLETLNKSTPEFTEGVEQLDDGINQLSENLPQYSQNGLDNLKTAVLTPIRGTGTEDTKNYNQVPFYIILALSFGALICYLFFDAYPKNLFEQLSHKHRKTKLWVLTLKHQLLPAITMVVVSIALSTVAYFFLDMSPVEAASFYLFTIFCAIMFTSIQQFLNAWFDRSGTVVGLFLTLATLLEWFVSPANPIVEWIYAFTPEKAAIETLMSFVFNYEYNYLAVLYLIFIWILGFVGTLSVLTYKKSKLEQGDHVYRLA